MPLTDNPAPYLSSDSPISEIADERLGRMGFVRLLARRIVAYRGDRALVIGVCGPWGSGKTSILNLLVNEVNAARPALDRTVLEPVKFTPWALGNGDDMAHDLLQQLGRTVRDRAGTVAAATEIGGTITEVAATFGVAYGVAYGADVAGAPAWLSSAAVGLGLAGRIRAAFDRHTRKRTAPTLQEATDRVAAKIRQHDALLVVALDDLDRLAAEQIHAVFRVVRAIADFPNTVYVLSMDRHRVADALRDEYGDGHDYLGKFLNLTFDVPAPDAVQLAAYFDHQLEQVHQARDFKFDTERLVNVWHAGLNRLVKTPRDVVRVLNSFDMAMDAIAHETDAVDLLALEALRVLVPTVHRELAARPFGVLVETNDLVEMMKLPRGAEREKYAAGEFEAVISAAPSDSRPYVRSLLEAIFPRSQRGGHADKNSLHRSKRAASIHHFDNYFRWSMTTETLTELEMRTELDALVAATTDHTLEVWLARNDRRFKHLGEKVFHYIDEVDDDARRFDLAAGMLRVAHRLEDSASLFSRSKHMTALALAYHLVKGRAGWDAEVWNRCKDTTWLYGITRHVGLQFLEPHSANRAEGLDPATDATRAALSSAVAKGFAEGVYDTFGELPGFLYRWRDVAGNPSGPRGWLAARMERRDPVIWRVIDQLVHVDPVADTFGDHYADRNVKELEGLFVLDDLRKFVDAVAHPDGEQAPKLLATRRALDPGP